MIKQTNNDNNNNNRCKKGPHALRPDSKSVLLFGPTYVIASALRSKGKSPLYANPSHTPYSRLFKGSVFTVTPSPPIKSLGFRGFDSSKLLIIKGGNSHVHINL